MQIICINIALMKKRQTAAKKQIREMLSRHHALTAAELSQKLPQFDLSTIYRNLNGFVADGSIRELTLGLGTARYELSHTGHHHFVCISCKLVRTVSIDISHQSLARKMPDGYQVDDASLLIEGRCANCS